MFDLGMGLELELTPCICDRVGASDDMRGGNGKSGYMDMIVTFLSRRVVSYKMTVDVFAIDFIKNEL